MPLIISNKRKIWAHEEMEFREYKLRRPDFWWPSKIKTIQIIFAWLLLGVFRVVATGAYSGFLKAIPNIHIDNFSRGYLQIPWPWKVWNFNGEVPRTLPITSALETTFKSNQAHCACVPYESKRWATLSPSKTRIAPLHVSWQQNTSKYLYDMLQTQ